MGIFQTRSVAVLAPLLGLALWAGALEWPQANAEASHRSGYALTEQSCGQAPNAYPKLRIGMREGYCAGLVAERRRRPRSFRARSCRFPDIASSWSPTWAAGSPAEGRLLLLDPALPPGKRISELIDRARLSVRAGDRPRRQDLRLDLGDDLPVRSAGGRSRKHHREHHPGIARPEDDAVGRHRGRGERPSAQAIRVRQDRAHLCQCRRADRQLRCKRDLEACAAGEGPPRSPRSGCSRRRLAASFRALKPGDPNPPREIFARGLRNSMALAVHPRISRPMALRSCRPRTARDLPDPMKPNEELNAHRKGQALRLALLLRPLDRQPGIQGVPADRSALTRISATTRRSIASRYSLLPPHAAPLEHVLLSRQANSRSCKASSLSACTATGRPAAG